MREQNQKEGTKQGWEPSICCRFLVASIDFLLRKRRRSSGFRVSLSKARKWFPIGRSKVQNNLVLHSLKKGTSPPHQNAKPEFDSVILGLGSLLDTLPGSRAKDFGRGLVVGHNHLPGKAKAPSFSAFQLVWGPGASRPEPATQKQPKPSKTCLMFDKDTTSTTCRSLPPKHASIETSVSKKHPTCAAGQGSL